MKIKVPWMRTIRRETGIVEHICKCGVGHPAFASVDFFNKALGLAPDDMSLSVHGCCGCCSKPEWQLADARLGSCLANTIILTQKETIHELRTGGPYARTPDVKTYNTTTPRDSAPRVATPQVAKRRRLS